MQMLLKMLSWQRDEGRIGFVREGGSGIVAVLVEERRFFLEGDDCMQADNLGREATVQ